jgi:hypothetical protein
MPGPLGVCEAEVGKHPDLLVGPPTSTVFPTNDRNFERSQFFEKIFEKIYTKTSTKVPTFVRNRQMIEIFREKKKKDLNLGLGIFKTP